MTLAMLFPFSAMRATPFRPSRASLVKLDAVRPLSRGGNASARYMGVVLAPQGRFAQEVRVRRVGSRWRGILRAISPCHQGLVIKAWSSTLGVASAARRCGSGQRRPLYLGPAEHIVREFIVLDQGWRRLHGYLDAAAQAEILEAVRGVAAAAPFVRPVTPWGKPMRVQMTSAGAVGWVTDRRGYRYEPTHPETGAAWPAIPEPILAVWRAVAEIAVEPDSCLINHYGEGARMGLHQDKDEADFRAPVVSISLGDPATFRVGGLTRDAPTSSFRLESGDVLVMGGAARLAFHGVDRIKFGAHPFLLGDPLFGGGRLNLTLRRAAAF